MGHEEAHLVDLAARIPPGYRPTYPSAEGLSHLQCAPPPPPPAAPPGFGRANQTIATSAKNSSADR